MLVLKEKALLPESKSGQEALEKIRGLKEKSPEEIAKLFPEIKKEILKEWREKRHQIELEAVETGQDLYFEGLYDLLYELEAGFTKEDQLDKKFLKKFKTGLVEKTKNLIKERIKLAGEFVKIIKTKNNQEILAKAESGYKSLIQEALSTNNLKYKIYLWQNAYDAAKKFLDSKWQENVLDIILDEINKNANLFTNEDKRQIKFLVNNEILELIQKKERSKALKLAQDFEKVGLLDLEKDSSIFDKLTA
jgi:hypothetical protein